MALRRAVLALSVFAFLAASTPVGVAPARAQSVGEAERAADEAERDVEDAYSVVSGAVSDRDDVEAELFDALLRYEEAVQSLAVANRRLESVAQSLASAEAGAAGITEALRDQAVQAYMQAISNPASMVMVSDTVETAMVVDQAFGEDQVQSFERLNGLTAQQAELERLRGEYQTERDRVAELEAELGEESRHLEDLFAQADAAVAAAYHAAAAADAAYREALSDVERARAAEEERRRAAAASTTTTTTTTSPPAGPTTTTPDDPGTTTTTTTTGGNRPPLKASVERWRSLAASHFPGRLVEDALYIIQCESAGDPSAVNPYSGASGLFQFIPGTWAVASVSAGVGDRSVFDPEANVIAAAWLAGYYESNGRYAWTPWSCRSSL